METTQKRSRIEFEREVLKYHVPINNEKIKGGEGVLLIM